LAAGESRNSSRRAVAGPLPAPGLETIGQFKRLMERMACARCYSFSSLVNRSFAPNFVAPL
jgi:hypothetical protein